MKTIGKINIIIVLIGLFFTACTKDEILREPSPLVSENSKNVFFTKNNVLNYELEPTDPTKITVTVAREKSQGAATAAIKVLSNSENVFNIPASVTFADGVDTTTFEVSFPTAAEGIKYSFEVSFDGEQLNPYLLKTTTISKSVTRLKWDVVGEGQFYDSWTLYSAPKIQIQYSALKKTYRFASPYSRALLVEAEWDNWIGGPTTDYIKFQITPADKVTYTSWYVGLNYQGNEGQPVQAFFPSYLGDIRNVTTYDVEDAKSIVKEKDANGKPLLLEIQPRIYIIGVGGYGLKKMYISFPGGPDLKTLLGL